MRIPFASVAAGLLAACVTGPALAQPATGSTAYSPGVAEDKISWQLFVEVVSPAPAPNLKQALTFETWATDAETFSASTTPPTWPTGPTTERNKQRFQVSSLGLHRPARLQVAVDSSGVPTPCATPADPAAGNFPTPATAKPPVNCLAEEVRRNKPSFDYIVQNNLYTVAGLATNFPLTAPIALPQSSDLKKAGIEVKVDWVPLNTVVTWLNANLPKPIDAAFVRKNYFIASQPDGTDYALVSMHISLKDRPNWLWATFEHQLNPGRCDTMGCYDQFGLPTTQASIPPATAANTQYPACAKKSAALAKMLGGLPTVWNNYCLKDTQIDFVSVQATTKGQPLLNGDSVVERILAGVPIAQSSCISCHAYATFGSKGCIAQNNPGISSPAPIGAVTQQPGQKRYDFVWGVITIPNGVCQ
ncbi:MAG: hypothetical protein ABI411_02795 [Tahibacter sp.]